LVPQFAGNVHHPQRFLQRQFLTGKFGLRLSGLGSAHDKKLERRWKSDRTTTR